jgi:hypothetical protein
VDGGHLDWTLTPDQLTNYCQGELAEVAMGECEEEVVWIGNYKGAEKKWLTVNLGLDLR